MLWRPRSALRARGPPPPSAVQLLPFSYVPPRVCVVVGDREIQSTNRQRELYHHLYTELDHKVTGRRRALPISLGAEPFPTHQAPSPFYL